VNIAIHDPVDDHFAACGFELSPDPTKDLNAPTTKPCPPRDLRVSEHENRPTGCDKVTTELGADSEHAASQPCIVENPAEEVDSATGGVHVASDLTVHKNFSTGGGHIAGHLRTYRNGSAREILILGHRRIDGDSRTRLLCDRRRARCQQKYGSGKG